MGLIADIVESFRAANRAIGDAFKWAGDEMLSDLQNVGAGYTDVFTTITEGGDFSESRAALGDIRELAVFSSKALSDPQQFAKELFEKWNQMLGSALASLNIEFVGPDVAINVNSIDSVQSKLRQGSVEAKERVSIAIGIINLIILTGSAVSIAAEAASKGSVRSIAEAIQSWVWANGLGSFSTLAFQPQVNASIMPYLQRSFNAGARAQIPPVTDIIRFQLREIYLEGRREELVGTEDRPVYDALMAEWGFDKFHADSYWGAHWQLPSIGQLNEMLFRGVIDAPEWERFVRFNDMEPTSIPRLREIIYNPYTRVDTRRMHRMGILDDNELLQAYADNGFYAPTVEDAAGKFRAVFVADPDFTVHKAQALVVFTKVFNLLPELRQRYAKGWIGPDVILEELRTTGIPEMRARNLYETIVKSDKTARTAPERELTRGLIARAWKLRLVSFDQAIFLMQRLGWDFAEAELILRVQSQPDDPLAFVQTNLGARLGAGAARVLEEEILFEGA